MFNLPSSVLNEIERRFGSRSSSVVEQLQVLELPLVTSARLHARIVVAILWRTGEKVDSLEEAIAAAETDWRDLLVGEGLADGDWPLKIAESGIDMADWQEA